MPAVGAVFMIWGDGPDKRRSPCLCKKTGISFTAYAGVLLIWEFMGYRQPDKQDSITVCFAGFLLRDMTTGRIPE